MKKLLLVEDERNFALILRDYPSMNGFEVTLAVNGEEGLAAFLNDSFDMCILDIMMPRKDGFSLASEIRQRNRSVPLFFLTARGMRDDMIKGYRLGADDYIVKPFDSEVLLMKIRAMLQRSTLPVHTEITSHSFGSFSFNARTRALTGPDGCERTLSPKESQLLNLLCHHRDEVLPRETALKTIWKEDTYFTARSMDVYIVKLRKHLAADPRLEISNVHGNGYRLVVRD